MSLLTLAKRCPNLADACVRMYTRATAPPGCRLAPPRLAHPRTLPQRTPLPFALRPRRPAGPLTHSLRRPEGLVSATPRAASSSSISEHTDQSREELEREIDSLLKKLQQLDDAYYNNPEPEPSISDGQYDSLSRRLDELQDRLLQIAGPTPLTAPRPVGAPPANARLPKVQHALPMTSLEAAANKEAVLDWYSRLAENEVNLASSGKGWVVEPKVDGLAVSLQYHKGRLVLAATRGNGELGEDVTHNAPHISGIPPVLKGWAEGGLVPDVVEVRGEVFIFKDDLQQVNERLKEAGQKPLANPRNAAAGSLMLSDPAAAATRRLSFFAYSLYCPPTLSKSLARPTTNGNGNGNGTTHGNGNGNGISNGVKPPPSGGLPPAHIATTQWEALDWLQQQEFRVFPAVGDRKLVGSFREAVDAAEAWMAGRGSLGYEADGAVLKVNSLTEQQRLGVVSGDPKWAVAWKFPSQEAVTVLRGIELNTGRTGIITPVALLDPVAIGGVVVQRATLHNVGMVTALGLQLGDHVLLRRSGDVIPQVVAALPEFRTGKMAPWEPPTCCPACQGPVDIQKGEGGAESLVCCNPGCSGQHIQGLKHWADTCIKGIGASTLQSMAEAGLVNSVADLYYLTKEDLLKLDKVKDRKALNMLQAIDASRRADAPTILHALGIKLVGDEFAKQLCGTYGTLQQLSEAAQALGAEEKLQAIPNLGPEMARSIVAWFRSPGNQQLLERLHEGGVAAIRGMPASSSGRKSLSAAVERVEKPLEGKKVLATGTFPDLTRSQLKQRLEALGADVATSVSKSLDLVIIGSDPGASKLVKIRDLGLPTMDAAEFLERYGQHMQSAARAQEAAEEEEEEYASPMRSREVEQAFKQWPLMGVTLVYHEQRGLLPVSRVLSLLASMGATVVKRVEECSGPTLVVVFEDEMDYEYMDSLKRRIKNVLGLVLEGTLQTYRPEALAWVRAAKGQVDGGVAGGAAGAGSEAAAAAPASAVVESGSGQAGGSGTLAGSPRKRTRAAGRGVAPAATPESSRPGAPDGGAPAALEPSELLRVHIYGGFSKARDGVAKKDLLEACLNNLLAKLPRNAVRLEFVGKKEQATHILMGEGRPVNFEPKEGQAVVTVWEFVRNMWGDEELWREVVGAAHGGEAGAVARAPQAEGGEEAAAVAKAPRAARGGKKAGAVGKEPAGAGGGRAGAALSVFLFGNFTKAQDGVSSASQAKQLLDLLQEALPADKGPVSVVGEARANYIVQGRGRGGKKRVEPRVWQTCASLPEFAVEHCGVDEAVWEKLVQRVGGTSGAAVGAGGRAAAADGGEAAVEAPGAAGGGQAGAAVKVLIRGTFDASRDGVAPTEKVKALLALLLRRRPPHSEARVEFVASRDSDRLAYIIEGSKAGSGARPAPGQEQDAEQAKGAGPAVVRLQHFVSEVLQVGEEARAEAVSLVEGMTDADVKALAKQLTATKQARKKAGR